MSSNPPKRPLSGVTLDRSALRKGFVATLLLLVWALCGASQKGQAQLSTEDHVAEPGFWPTQGQKTTKVFSGKDSCARCHAGISRSAALSSMARTLVHGDQASLLRKYEHLSFTFGSDAFHLDTTISHEGSVSRYQVSDGKKSLDAMLEWIFGTGRVGQSYLFKRPDGKLYEAPITFFDSLKNIGFTPARELAASANLEMAMGRHVDSPELIRCFSCHATEVNIDGNFNEAGVKAGVTCEACHGPGAAHVGAMRNTNKPTAAKELAIFQPENLSPTESVEFCGSCHGSFWDVRLAHVTGPSTARSAPYRLVTSKCWGKEGDPRLVCTACHNPHEELNTNVSSYDTACLRCHANASDKRIAATRKADVPMAPACPVAKENCASCHMLKVDVPEMKNTFTDHRIRVVKVGEPFRD